MHDGGGNRQQTIAALPQIIQGIQAKGLRLVTVPELLKDEPPPAGQALPTNLSGADRRRGRHQAAQAGLARPADHDLVLGQTRRQAVAELGDRALDAGVAERLESAAALAHEMVVVARAVAHRLEADAVLADFHPLQGPIRSSSSITRYTLARDTPRPRPPQR